MTLPAGEVPACIVKPPDFVRSPGLAAILAALPEARIVGGAVRDTLAGLRVADVDLATPREPEAVAAALRAARIRAVPTGIAHGTVTAVSDHRGFEITTLRRDVETDGRHAVVSYSADWREDAARRDFTINAMSMTPAGEVFDYFGGIADLARGRIRFVGNAEARIREDYLRALRFFRFHARFAHGEPDADALGAIAATVGGLARLSAERVWSELKRILAVPDPDGALVLMARLGVLGAILPGAPETLPPLAHLPPDALLRLVAIDPGDTEDLAVRLKLASAERERLVALRGPALAEDSDDDDIRRALADVRRDVLIDRAWLAGRSKRLRERIASIETPEFPIRGRDLRAAGVPPGAALGALLAELRLMWLASGCRLGEAELRAELARRLAP